MSLLWRTAEEKRKRWRAGERICLLLFGTDPEMRILESDSLQRFVPWNGSQESGEEEQGREGGQERSVGTDCKMRILEKVIH